MLHCASGRAAAGCGQRDKSVSVVFTVYITLLALPTEAPPQPDQTPGCQQCKMPCVQQPQCSRAKASSAGTTTTRTVPSVSAQASSFLLFWVCHIHAVMQAATPPQLREPEAHWHHEAPFINRHACTSMAGFQVCQQHQLSTSTLG